ncbi:Protein of unknown function [Gryllus bimaculatus]|nr:Protein of unknown function [Gryllus bimaculatus]
MIFMKVLRVSDWRSEKRSLISWVVVGCGFGLVGRGRRQRRVGRTLWGFCLFSRFLSFAERLQDWIGLGIRRDILQAQVTGLRWRVGIGFGEPWKVYQLKRGIALLLGSAGCFSQGPRTGQLLSGPGCSYVQCFLPLHVVSWFVVGSAIRDSWVTL